MHFTITLLKPDFISFPFIFSSCTFFLALYTNQWAPWLLAPLDSDFHSTTIRTSHLYQTRFFCRISSVFLRACTWVLSFSCMICITAVIWGKWRNQYWELSGYFQAQKQLFWHSCLSQALQQKCESKCSNRWGKGCHFGELRQLKMLGKRSDILIYLPERVQHL